MTYKYRIEDGEHTLHLPSSVQLSLACFCSPDSECNEYIV